MDSAGGEKCVDESFTGLELLLAHATQLQAKCASKYAPAKPGEAPAGNTAMLAPAK